MSKILELAQEIDKEVHELHNETSYLFSELAKEKQKRKNLLEKLQSLIEEELYNVYE